MSKKYLTIEEAAAKVGVSTAELNRLREKGTIRAFADRGTWKFKEDDVEKLARSRQADSDPDVPLHSFESSASDQISDLVFADDPLGSEPTIIRTGRDDDSGSDSDVRLIFDDSPSKPEIKAGPPAEDSDSDVKLAGGAQAVAKDDGSDSDVKLVTDVEPTEPAGSDSDVQLVSSDSSGDVKVASSGDVKIPSSGDVKVASSGDVKAIREPSSSDSGRQQTMVTEDSSAVTLSPTGEGSSIIEGDSGISLADGSGIAITSDSGISLERPNDSGISLAEESSIVLSEDSGISLAQDSGISLSRSGDSGISLSQESDSGIALAPDSGKDSGISLAPAGKPGAKGDKKGKGKGPKAPDSDHGTVPLMDIPAVEDEDILDTQMEVPMLEDSSEGGSTGSGTSVITLDDDDNEYSLLTGGKRSSADDTGEQDVFGEEAIVEDADEAVEVADEIIGEDDELAEDVFGAEDEDFGDVESGVSSADLPVSTRLAAPVEQDWGTPTHVAVTMAAGLMVVCGWMMFNMVRNMWYTDVAKQDAVATMLLDVFK